MWEHRKVKKPTQVCTAAEGTHSPFPPLTAPSTPPRQKLSARAYPLLCMYRALHTQSSSAPLLPVSSLHARTFPQRMHLRPKPAHAPSPTCLQSTRGPFGVEFWSGRPNQGTLHSSFPNPLQAARAPQQGSSSPLQGSSSAQLQSQPATARVTNQNSTGLGGHDNKRGFYLNH